MAGHTYLLEDIPPALWKDFKLACISIDTTAKKQLIACIEHLVTLYLLKQQDAQAGPIYQHKKEKKK